MTVYSYRIVKRFNVFKYEHIRFIIVSYLKEVEPFPLNHGMKGFYTGIIVRFSFVRVAAAHIFCTLCDTRVAQSEYLEFLDKELNTAYKKVMALLPQKEKNRLRNDERKWIKTRDEQAEKNSAEFKGGTLESFECSRTLIEYDEQRLMYLAKYYDRVRSKK